jgi:hypothetical protein
MLMSAAGSPPAGKTPEQVSIHPVVITKTYMGLTKADLSTPCGQKCEYAVDNFLSAKVSGEHFCLKNRQIAGGHLADMADTEFWAQESAKESTT